MRTAFSICSVLSLLLGCAGSIDAVLKSDPIIDMHLHAFPLAFFGTPDRVCAPPDEFPAFDPRDEFGTYSALMSCEDWLSPATTDQELLDATLNELKRNNIVLAVTSGSRESVQQWRREAHDRIIPALVLSPSSAPELDQLRQMFESGEIQVLGEVLAQLEGIAPNDPILEPYFALAEEMDIPVAIHVGTGGPGVSLLYPEYRSALSSALLLEKLLLRHPKLRLYVMHGGWPMLDDMIQILLAFPQVYLDVSYVNWGHTRLDHDHYLRRLVESGFGKRIMFGSDHSIWPGTIAVAIDSIRSAPYLSREQKRDILYNNAARFLRLDGSPN